MSKNVDEAKTCSVCGTALSGVDEFCRVCMLRKGLAGGVESGVSSISEVTIKPTSEQAAQRFEHYELALGQDGKPVELGRGAMGVTYKALDVELRCPVTLKVISERYVGDESARLRFLRGGERSSPECCLGLPSGQNREQLFLRDGVVEGVTLEKLIKRSGRLEVKLALEIATQTAAGLAAVHKQNIMVSAKEGARSKWPQFHFYAQRQSQSFAGSFDENRVWSIHCRPGCEPSNPSDKDSGTHGDLMKRANP
jgi:hypothetical protein